MWTAERRASRTLSWEAVGDGPPLILLHGLSGSRRWWERNVTALAPHFRTYTVDLPGFGESRGVRWSRLEHTADLLCGWMTDQGIARAHVAGHSMGGAVAALLASHHPETVDRLVLVNAAIRPRGTRATARAADVMRTLSRTPPGFTPLLARDLLRAHPRSFVTATVNVLQAEWRPHLSRITAPTLVVWGEHDVLTPLDLGYSIAALVPDARLEIVPDAGHTPMWEQPAAFNDIVLTFLDGLETRCP
jgi:pimeloyl-ACP methyl ester carboxylesterase